jgi:putative serine protease PepD
VLLGDLIVAIDKKPVTNSDELFAALDSYRIGDTVSVIIRRNSEEKKIAVTLRALQ